MYLYIRCYCSDHFMNLSGSPFYRSRVGHKAFLVLECAVVVVHRTCAGFAADRTGEIITVADRLQVFVLYQLRILIMR